LGFFPTPFEKVISTQQQVEMQDKSLVRRIIEKAQFATPLESFTF